MKLRHSKKTVDNVSWTPIQPTIDCYKFELINTGSEVLNLRTDQADANTEVPLQPLQPYPIEAPRNTVIQKNGIIMYAQFAAPLTTTVTIRCVGN